MGTTAAIYTRLSRRTETNAPNLDQQEQLLRTRADDMGLEVVRVFRDHGESAFDGHERPEYVALVELVQEGGVDHVLALDSDRLWRDTVDQALFLRDAAAAGVESIITSQAVIDPQNPTDELTSTIMAAVGRYESNVKRHRILRKHVQIAEAGKLAGGGTRPYGYEKDRMTIVPEEADVVRQIIAQVIDGESPKAVAAKLNANGVPSVTGKPWRGMTVKTIATSWRVAGIRSHHDEPVTDAVWPAIVSRVEVERARAAIAHRATTAPAGRQKKLLTGLLACTCCGEPMVSRPKNGRPSYVIAQDPARGITTHRRIEGDPLEALVIEAVFEVVDARSLAEHQPTDDGAGKLSAEIEADRKLLAEMGERLANREMSLESFTAFERTVRERIDANEAELARMAITAPGADLDGLRDRWPELDHDKRRQILTALIERIEIGPAVRGRNKFDPSRVDVRWRS